MTKQTGATAKVNVQQSIVALQILTSHWFMMGPIPFMGEIILVRVYAGDMNKKNRMCSLAASGYADAYIRAMVLPKE